MNDPGNPEQIRAELNALRAAVEELTRKVEAVNQAALSHDEQGIVSAVAVAGPGFGWPSEATRTPVTEALQPIWKQLGSLATTVESLTRLTVPIWASHAELERAGEVQHKLIPPTTTEVPGAVVHSWWQPAAACGGDWWTAHALDEDRGLVAMGDVTGHGAPAALITAIIRGACDLARMGMRAQLQPGQLLRMLNRIILETSGQDFMSTSIAFTTRRGSSKVYVANAGHRAPFLLSGGRWSLVQGEREPLLGSQPAVTYTQLAIPVSPGDRLVVFTDGLPEAENAHGQQLGERAIRQACDQSSGDPTGAGLRDRFEQLVTEHNRPLRPRDDVTVLVIDIG